MERSKLFQPRYWLSQTIKIFKTALERFPLAIAFFTAFAVLLIYDTAVPYDQLKDYRDVINRIYGTLTIGITLSMATKVLLERLKKGLKEGFFTAILVILVTIAYFYFLLPQFTLVTTTRLILTNAALLLAFLFIPYLVTRENFEIYITNLISKVAITIFFMVILGLGVTALIFAIKALLIENLSSDFYTYTWIITAFIFAPTYFFYSLPKYNYKMTKEDFATPIKVALIYLVLPLLTAYTVVLYLYFARIIILWDWPSGIVSYLVSSYAAVGLVATFLVWPFRKENKWVDLFTKVFTKVVYPLLVMMFIAIYLRINQYGFTENRYFIVAIGLWATFAMSFINFDKGRRNTVLVVSLALTLIIASYGPISATSVAIRSQSNRFESILSRNEMLTNNEIVPNSDIPKKDKRELVNIMRYFNYEHELNYLTYLPNDFTLEKTESIFGFPDYGWDDTPRPDTNYFSFNANLAPFTLDEYQLMIPFMQYRYSEPYLSEPLSFMEKDYSLKAFENTIKVYQGEEVVLDIDLTTHAASMIEKFGLDKYDMSGVDMSFVAENELVKVKVVYIYLSGNFKPNTELIETINSEGYLLINIK